MKNLFTDLESQFARLDRKLNDLVQIIDTNCLNVDTKINNTYSKIHLIIKDIFNSKRTNLIKQLDELFKNNIKNSQKPNVLFRKSSSCILKLSLIILGQLKYDNEFDLVKKFLYLEMYNFFTELKIPRDQIDFFDVKITALSRYKLLVYSKQNCFLKIVNQNCEELSNRRLNRKLLYKSILCYDTKIATLFQDSETKKHYLILYDDNLNLISYKSFDFDLHLCSVDIEQVICWFVSKRTCVIYDHNLSELCELGQSVDTEKPYYFCDENNEINQGKLIDVSDKKILFYFNDQKGQSFKIINRNTGGLDGEISIPPESVTKLIKFDSKSNILIRQYPDVSLRLYDSNGILITTRSTTQFTNLIRFDIISTDEIVCYDSNKDKLFYF